MNRRIRSLIATGSAVLALAVATPLAAAASDRSGGPTGRPTIVLVHGAFADSSSWAAEIGALKQKKYPVVAVSNPLRGVAADTAYLQSVLATIDGPIVLVGHSYAGFLIGPAAAADPDVKALVYVAAYIPQPGETPSDLTYKDLGSLLTNENLDVRPSPSGTDLYIKQDVFGKVYAGGLPQAVAQVAAVVQRPITAEALGEPATIAPPAATPKWQIVATDDHAIPTATQQFMAQRAGATIVKARSGHDVPAAQPLVVTRVVLDAARAVH